MSLVPHVRGDIRRDNGTPSVSLIQELCIDSFDANFLDAVRLRIESRTPPVPLLFEVLTEFEGHLENGITEAVQDDIVRALSLTGASSYLVNQFHYDDRRLDKTVQGDPDKADLIKDMFRVSDDIILRTSGFNRYREPWFNGWKYNRERDICWQEKPHPNTAWRAGPGGPHLFVIQEKNKIDFGNVPYNRNRNSETVSEARNYMRLMQPVLVLCERSYPFTYYTMYGTDSRGLNNIKRKREDLGGDTAWTTAPAAWVQKTGIGECRRAEEWCDIAYNFGGFPWLVVSPSFPDGRVLIYLPYEVADHLLEKRWFRMGQYETQM